MLHTVYDLKYLYGLPFEDNGYQLWILCRVVKILEVIEVGTLFAGVASYVKLMLKLMSFGCSTLLIVVDAQ